MVVHPGSSAATSVPTRIAWMWLGSWREGLRRRLQDYRRPIYDHRQQVGVIQEVDCSGA